MRNNIKSLFMKYWGVFFRNFQNNFSKRFILSVILILLSPFVVYFSIVNSFRLIHYLLLQLAESPTMDWIRESESVDAVLGFGKFMFIIIICVFTGILNIGGCVIAKSWGKYYLLMVLINYVVQVGCIVYDQQFTITIVLLSVYPMWACVNWYHLKLVYVPGSLASIFVMCKSLHWFANQYLFEFINTILKGDNVHIGECGKTVISYVFMVVFIFILSACICLYGGIFYGYWWMYCFFVLADTKIQEVDQVDPYLPNLMLVLYTDYEVREGRKFRIDYVLTHSEEKRTVVTFILIAVLFIPLVFYIRSWKWMVMYFLSVPIIIEVFIKSIRACIQSLRIIKNKNSVCKSI
jgi:hypothetical protein